jgi:hypothetical protein
MNHVVVTVEEAGFPPPTAVPDPRLLSIAMTASFPRVFTRVGGGNLVRSAFVYGNLFVTRHNLLIEQVTYNANEGKVQISFRPGGVRTLAAEHEEVQT